MELVSRTCCCLFVKKYQFYESFKYIVNVHTFMGDLQLIRKIFVL